MTLFRQIDGWIQASRAVLVDVAASGVAPGCPLRFLLPEPPAGMPRLDVLLVGEPSAGKSALGNLLVGYQEEPLVRDAVVLRELPRFHEEMVSVARRFADRYAGSETIPASEAQAASLPSVPVVLGVRFTEMWGMDRARPIAQITGPLLDSHPDRAVLVLVVRADQQIDGPEEALLAHIATSPWKDSVIVVLNLRTRGDDVEQVIKLKGFVEEQCVRLAVRPRGVFAFCATDGASQVAGERERFEDALASTLARLWTAENRLVLRTLLAGPVDRARGTIIASLGLASPTVEELRHEHSACLRELAGALDGHDRSRQAAIEDVDAMAEASLDRAASDLLRLPDGELPARPRELLRTFRREAIGAIEGRLGPCEDTSGWPVPDLVVKPRPGPGCAPIAGAVFMLVVAVVTAVALQWVLTAVFGGLTVLFAALTVGLYLRARSRWHATTLDAYRAALGAQKKAARTVIETEHASRRDPARLSPSVEARARQLELALSAVVRLEAQAAGLDDVLRPPAGEMSESAAPPARRPGHHARRLAAALGPRMPLNEMFHENGFDLEAPDLFGRLCQVEYALLPIASLQSVQTVRGWLRPPMGRRERSIYPFLDRLRIRYDELAQRTRTVAQRLLKRADAAQEGAPAPALTARVAPVAGQPPRVAIAEEALERILGRVLDEAMRHQMAQAGTGLAVDLSWSLGEGPGAERCALLELALHGGRGFDPAGRQAFDSARGGLARFLADTSEGALGWCSSVEIRTVDAGRGHVRVVDGSGGVFEPMQEPPGQWSTLFTFSFPAVIEEDARGV